MLKNKINKYYFKFN